MTLFIHSKLFLKLLTKQEKPIKHSFYYKSFICNINLGQGRILGQGQILGQGRIWGQGRILGSRSCPRSMCVWLHLALPDVSVDSADGASSGLIR